MRRPRQRSLIAAFLALTMTLAACGGDDAGSAAEPEEDAPLALELDEADEADEEEAVEEAEAVEEVETVAFDLAAEVESYASTIPDGWMNVGDLDAFKDALTVEGTVLIDVREESDYAEGHLPGAINIPIRTVTQNLEHIPTDRPVFVYCASGWRAGLVVSSLRMLGYDNVTAYAPSVAGWTAAGEELVVENNEPETFEAPEVQPEMLEAIDSFLSTLPDGFLTNPLDGVKDAIDAGAVLVDVRETGEFEEGAIPGAISIPLRTVASSDAIPTDTNVIVHCLSGYRAAVALPILHVLGYTNTSGFPGSYKAWVEAGEPVTS